MPATILLATYEPDLLRAWWVAVPAGRSVVTLEDIKGTARIESDAPVVVVLDEAVRDRLPPNLAEAPTVVVGDAKGTATPHPSEAVKVRLSYLESRTRLAETLLLLEELALLKVASKNQSRESRQTSSPVMGNWERPVSAAPVDNPVPEGSASADQLWPFLNEMAEHVSSTDGLSTEFRRMVRMMMRCGNVAVFLRRSDGYRTVGGGAKGELFCPASDPLIDYLQSAPVLIDGLKWPVRCAPLIESGIRNRMVAWGARLIVPIHDNGWILGFVSLGIRDNGQPYTTADGERLTAMAGYFRRLLQQAMRWQKTEQEVATYRALKDHLPQLVILKPSDEPTVLLPAAIKTLVHDVRSSKSAAQLYPAENQPYRATAGYIAATQETWCQWADVSEETKWRAQRQRNERLTLLHDIALTLNHELGNALVSLSALRHSPGPDSNSPVLLAAIKRDISSLEVLNRHLASLPTFGDVVPETIDLGQLTQEIGRKVGITIEATQAPVMLCVVPPLVEFALQSIIDSVAENRAEQGKRGLVLQLKGDAHRATFSLKGANLILEGVAPAPAPDAAPTHGRISVFIAKEIIRLHGGTLLLKHEQGAPMIEITLCRW